MQFLKATPQVSVYEGEDANPAPPAKEEKKTFTQEDVNRLLAEDRRKHQSQNQKLVEQLEEFKKIAGLTAQQKADLETRIEELNTQHLTKEDQAKREKERLETDYKSQLTSTATERDSWKTRFTDSHIKREIVDAASQADAYDASQFVDHLFPKTRIVEEKDEAGQLTGEFKSVVKWLDTKDGKTVTLDLAVPEAIKRMKELPRFANYFKSNFKSGLGAGRDPGTPAKKDFKKMSADDYAEMYQAGRKKKG